MPAPSDVLTLGEDALSQQGARAGPPAIGEKERAAGRSRQPSTYLEDIPAFEAELVIRCGFEVVLGDGFHAGQLGARREGSSAPPPGAPGLARRRQLLRLRLLLSHTGDGEGQSALGKGGEETAH